MNKNIINLKDMLVDKFVIDASNEKAELRQVDLKVGNGIKTCFVVSKKKNIVQIKSIFADDTVEELEIEFVQNSLKIVSAKASTYLYKGGMDLQLLSEKEIKSLDINKHAVSIDDLYVPVNVLLTPYFKEKATNVVLSGAIKSLNMVGDNRIENKDDESKEIKLHTVIDMNVYDKDNKIVENVKNLSNKNILKLSKINDNVLYMGILAGNYNTDKIVSGTAKNHNVVNTNTFDETSFIQECAKNMKEYMNMENKSEIEITAFLINKMSKEDCELLLNNKIFRQSLMLETTEENTVDIDSALLGNGLFEIQGLKDLKEDEKIDLVMDLSIMKNKDKIKDIGTFKVQVKLLMEENIKDEIKDKEEVKMENIVNELQNDVVILNSVEKRLEGIKSKYQSYVSNDQLQMILKIAIVLGESEFNKIENEQIFRSTFGLEINEDTVNNREAAMIIANSLKAIANILDLKSVNGKEELDKQLAIYKISDSIDNVINKEEFVSNVIDIIERLTKIEENIETVETEIVNSVAKQENVVETKVKNKSNIQDIVPVNKEKEKKVSNNKVYIDMVKYISDTLGDKGLDKYKNELCFIHERLGKETIFNVAKNNKSINEILTRYTRNEINDSLAKGFEVISDLLCTLKKNIHGYEEIDTLIKLPVDVKVKLVYSLLEMNDITLDEMSIEDRALFYIILNKSLNVTTADMRQRNSSGEFALAHARTSVRNRHIVIRFIA